MCETKQQNISDPGVSWDVLMTTSFSRCWGNDEESFCHRPLHHLQDGGSGKCEAQEKIGSSDHEILGFCERLHFKFLRAGQKVCSKLPALGFRRAAFGLFRDLFGTIPWIKPCREDQPKKTG